MQIHSETLKCHDNNIESFENGSSANIKLSKTQLFMVIPIFGNILSGVAQIGPEIAKNAAKCFLD